jgi:hypothetical protein
MPTRRLAFTIVTLLGFSVQASAESVCPELTRLRMEAQHALKESRTVPASERCLALLPIPPVGQIQQQVRATARDLAISSVGIAPIVARMCAVLGTSLMRVRMGSQ